MLLETDVPTEPSSAGESLICISSPLLWVKHVESLDFHESIQQINKPAAINIDATGALCINVCVYWQLMPGLSAAEPSLCR